MKRLCTSGYHRPGDAGFRPAAWLAVLLLAGCATDQQSSNPLPAGAVTTTESGSMESSGSAVAPNGGTDGALAAPASSYVGEIVRVNTVDRYVVVRCRNLPSAGEEAKVSKRNWSKGLIRFSGPREGAYAAADIVRGEPEPGDEVMR